MCLHQLSRSSRPSYRAQKHKLSNRCCWGGGCSFLNNSSGEPQGVCRAFEKLGLESVNARGQDPHQMPSDQPPLPELRTWGAPARAAKAAARPPVAVAHLRSSFPRKQMVDQTSQALRFPRVWRRARASEAPPCSTG